MPATPRVRLVRLGGTGPFRADQRLGVTGAPEWAVIPDELFLRGLLALDVDSDDEVCAFIEAHGLPLAPFDQLVGLAVPAAVREATWQSFDLAAPRWTLSCLGRLVHHWIAAKEGMAAESAGAEAAALAAGAELLGVWADLGITSAREAWFGWGNLLNAFLGPFHVRVEVQALDDPAGSPRPDGLFVGLEAVLALQLVNAVTEDVPVQRCASETCDNYFSRKQGGAQHGQYRTKGVRYCSINCANAQGQRVHRRRKQQERSDNREGRS